MRAASERLTLAGLLLMAASVPLAAQSKDVKKAAASITEKDVRKRINLIADDSMMGRDTPSPGLETAAAYVASQFESFGLRPGGDSGSYMQRYPLVLRQLQADRSFVEFSSTDLQNFIVLPFTTSVIQHAGEADGAPKTAEILVIGGPPDPEKFPADSLVKGKFIVWVVDWEQVPKFANAMVIKAMTSGAAGVFAASNRDTTVIAQAAAQAGRVKVSRAEEAQAPGGVPLVLEFSQAAVGGAVPAGPGHFRPAQRGHRNDGDSDTRLDRDGPDCGQHARNRLGPECRRHSGRHRFHSEARIRGVLRAPGPHRHHARAIGQRQQRGRRRRFGKRRSPGAGGGVHAGRRRPPGARSSS